MIDLNNFSLQLKSTLTISNVSSLDVSQIVESESARQYMLAFSRGQSNQTLYIYRQEDFFLLQKIQLPYALEAMAYSPLRDLLIIGIQKDNY